MRFGSIGGARGALLARVAAHLMGSPWYGVEPRDLMSFVAAAALVLTMATAASFAAWKRAPFAVRDGRRCRQVH